MALLWISQLITPWLTGSACNLASSENYSGGEKGKMYYANVIMIESNSARPRPCASGEAGGRGGNSPSCDKRGLGSGKERLLSSPLNFPHHCWVQGFRAFEAHWQGAVCSEENVTSQAHFHPRELWFTVFPWTTLGTLLVGSGPLTQLSTSHHFLEPHDERNQQASWQCGSEFIAHSKVDSCVNHRGYVQG